MALCSSVYMTHTKMVISQKDSVFRTTIGQNKGAYRLSFTLWDFVCDLNSVQIHALNRNNFKGLILQ